MAFFNEAQFSGVADFFETQFSDKAYFIETKFSGKTYFSKAKFNNDKPQIINFIGAKFKDACFFNDLTFNKQSRGSYFDFRQKEFKLPPLVDSFPSDLASFKKAYNSIIDTKKKKEEKKEKGILPNFSRNT